VPIRRNQPYVSGANHRTVALAGPAHGCQAVDDGGLKSDLTLAFLGRLTHPRWAAPISRSSRFFLGQPELTDDPRFLTNDCRVTNRSALRAEFDSILSKR
jgi:crotonobetainyl-CoA:carnitine CoA-transferase CaiB-like acyl-CoA transferase